MTGLVVYGAAGFVASTLLTGPRLPPLKLTLIDHESIEQSVLDSLSRANILVEVVQSSSMAEIVADDADVLLVLAGQTDVDQALAEPALAFETNMTIAIESAEWWRRHPQVRLIYLSSDEVLGASSCPLNEEAPFRPTQPYAASKAAAEMALRCYSESYGLELVVIRSCNLVGSRQRARKLIPTAVHHLASGLPVPIFGDGSHRREYLAVEDLCEVISQAIARTLPSGTYNCTSGIALQTIEVVAIVAEALGVETICTHVKDRLVHDRCYAMDASKLNAHGWKLQVTPADAITAAAIELKAAWDNGQVLTHRASARSVSAYSPTNMLSSRRICVEVRLAFHLRHRRVSDGSDCIIMHRSSSRNVLICRVSRACSSRIGPCILLMLPQPDQDLE
jgi:dTDP-glucose 4,6-dehydratase